MVSNRGSTDIFKILDKFFGYWEVRCAGLAIAAMLLAGFVAGLIMFMRQFHVQGFILALITIAITDNLINDGVYELSLNVVEAMKCVVVVCFFLLVMLLQVRSRKVDESMTRPSRAEEVEENRTTNGDFWRNLALSSNPIYYVDWHTASPLGRVVLVLKVSIFTLCLLN